VRSGNSEGLPDGGGLNPRRNEMLTIYGVPLSVHTRKVIVTAIMKKMDYRFEVVVPVIRDKLPPNWSTLSPTGLIPVIQDGDYTLADSNAICLYLDKQEPTPPILPSDTRDYGRSLWFDAYAGGTLFRQVVHPLFTQTVVNPNLYHVPSDKTVIDNVLRRVQPRIFGYLEEEIKRKFLVGDNITLADIAITSNFIIYQYMGYKIEPAQYPKLAQYLKRMAATAAFRKALDEEKPFVSNMGLDSSFLG
jgi:glutathione S-transferase